VTFQGVKTYSDPSNILSGGSGPPQPARIYAPEDNAEGQNCRCSALSYGVQAKMLKHEIRVISEITQPNAMKI